MSHLRLPLIALACVAIGCASGAGAGGCSVGFGIETENRAQIERFEALRDRFFIRHLLFNPVTATYLGADGYSDVLQSTNGALKDYSEAALARELAFYRESHQELQALAPESLPPNHRVDHRVMDAQLKFLIRLIGDRQYHQRAVDTYTTEPFRGIDWQMQQMQDAGDGLRGTEAEWTRLVTRVEAIPAYLDNARANLLAGKQAGNVPDWRMVQRNGIASSVASVEYFRRTLGENASGFIGNRPFGAALKPKVQQAGERAAASWQAFADFLNAAYANDTTDRYAAGTEEYEWRVRNIFGDTRSAEELYEYGAQQVALYSRRIDEVVAIIAKEAGLGAAMTRDVINHLAKDSPKNDDELFA